MGPPFLYALDLKQQIFVDEKRKMFYDYKKWTV